MTFKEALIDTIRFYSNDVTRRSAQCYFDAVGNKCAIGRLVRQDKKELFQRFDNHIMSGNIESVVHAYQAERNWAISETEAIAELTYISDANVADVSFLQLIHDENPNWDKDGLSSFGRATVRHFYPEIADEVMDALEVDEAVV